MNWLERKIVRYNVVIGLYMLDWWERYIVNILLVVLTWYLKYVLLDLLYPTIAPFCKSYLGHALCWLCSYSTFNDMMGRAAYRVLQLTTTGLQ